MLQRILVLVIFFVSGCCHNTPRQLEEVRTCHAETDQQRLAENVTILPSRCLTLDDIIDIALQNNLDLAVRAQQYAIQRETATRAALRMIPDLNVNIDWSYRNNRTAATAQVVSETSPPLPLTPPEIGSEQRTFQWNMGLAWNLLDFGLSYFQSQIECDNLIVAAMEYERTRQNLILSIVQRYWRAIISKKAVEIAAPLLKELARQRVIIESLVEDQFYLSKDKVYPLLNRIYQRGIQLKGFNDRTDSSDPTQGYDKEYENAMIDLAAIMGIPPDVEFELCPVTDLPYKLDYGNIQNLEDVALHNRPELYRYDAEEDVGRESVYQAILQEFPGVQLLYSLNHDDNRFLVNKTWWLVGIQSLWNLLKIPMHYTESVIGTEQEELAVRNRLVQSIAVLSQVHLGNVLYDQNLEQYTLAKQLADNYEKLIGVLIVEKEIGKVGAADLLQNQIDAALARISALKIYAELQSSIEQMNNAIGLPRYFQPED